MSDSDLKEMGIDIRLVDVTAIAVNDYNPNDMSAEIFEVLVDHIKSEGMQQPILVRENAEEEGKYIVVDGEHRLRASIKAGMEELAVVVVDYDDDMSKFKTVSMNEVRGEYIPLKMAKLLADLSDRYEEGYISRMTGIKPMMMESLSSLLEVPDVSFDSTATITTMDVSRPIPVNIMLMPDENGSYQQAMIKAMELAGPLVVPLVAKETAHYDKAMTSTFGLMGTKLRNVALATICQVFNALPENQKIAIIEEVSENKEL